MREGESDISARHDNLKGAGVGSGRVLVVGIGHGVAVGPVPQALDALRHAEVLVGYETYINRVLPEWSGARREVFDNGQESVRAHRALELAAAGEVVAVVCGGDAGIYGMAATMFQQRSIESEQLSRVDIKVIPGVTAAQVVSARLGAVLGEDFCAISLSDIKRDGRKIMHRLKAALAADFSIAIYNPASKTRRDLLREAMAMIIDLRGEQAAVVIAKRVGFADEDIAITPVKNVIVEEVGMTSLVMIPSSEHVVDRDNTSIIFPARYCST